MHIGFLTPEYPHSRVRSSAGIGTSLRNHIISLLDQGVRVSIFIYDQPFSEVIYEGELSLHLISKNNLKGFSWFNHRKQINQYVQKFVNSDGIDLIEVPDWTGISAFMNFSCPIVMRLHGSDGFFCYLENRKQKLKNFFLEYLALRSADYIISPNHFTFDITKKVFKTVSKNKVKIINLGLDLNFFNNSEPENFKPYTVYYFGTIIRKKGVFYLPSIFNEISNRIPETQFYVIGRDSFDIRSGSNSTWNLIHNLFSPQVLKNLSYLGQIDYSEMISHLKDANVCVFPSLAETTGMVTLEAMAMSRPVITSKEFWAEEIIDNSINGFCVDPSDHMRFADAASKILTNQNLALELGEKARFKIESDYDSKKIVLKNIQFYRQVIQSS